MKLARVIKMCLSKTYGKVHVGKHSPYRKWCKTWKCFIATAFQLKFRICDWKGSGKPGGTETKWDISSFGSC
jgi:hypothetical protein